ncbi:MAG: dienelactone hydrolase family protein [Bacteroidetes bacterium]|jgi:dienelactone hydrolase|nr:dienelactone hydrolase family protein [Bacteroidota bacterium]
MKDADYKEINIPIEDIELKGDLFIPEDARAIVIFSHGAGSSRKSPRNRMVADRLHKHGIGTLLFDLLTEEEDQHYPKRFDIELLTSRLIQATQWLKATLGKKKYSLGYFGASTGAASALKAAAALPEIKAVVSRGGRPDLAREALKEVQSPVLLIVGSCDQDVLKLNQYAYERLSCKKELTIIDRASHLFEEPGTLEKAADVACSWFDKYLLIFKITKSHVQRQT